MDTVGADERRPLGEPLAKRVRQAEALSRTVRLSSLPVIHLSRSASASPAVGGENSDDAAVMFLLVSTWLAINVWAAEYGWWLAAALLCVVQPRVAWRYVARAGSEAAVTTRAGAPVH